MLLNGFWLMVTEERLPLSLVSYFDAFGLTDLSDPIYEWEHLRFLTFKSPVVAEKPIRATEY